VGGLETRRVDVRVVAATNRDLVAEVAAGRFRSDLYYRLNIVELRLSPLRERKEDIPYLTAAFVREFSKQFHKSILGPTPAAERLLMTARWSGNVRELRNVIERVCILCDGNFFSERELLPMLSPSSRETAAADTVLERQAALVERADSVNRPLLALAERDHIRKVLQSTGNNKKVAAEMLGLSRRALYRRLERLGLR
jgi:two-component system, NtrC family, response regulator HydG